MMREHSCYENMPSAFCLMRADGSERIVRCNEMMLSLFQCSTEKAFLELTGGCLRGMVIAKDYRQISAQLGVWQREKSADVHYLDFELCTSAAHVRRVDMYLRRIEQDGEAFWSICLMDANMRTLMHVPGAMDGLAAARDLLSGGTAPGHERPRYACLRQPLPRLLQLK